MTIWLFGDSFASMNWKSIKDDQSWPELLAQNLNQIVRILGKNAAGPEHMFYMFNQYYEHFKPNDILIICFSSPLRKWYFFDRPNIANMNGVNRIRNRLSEKEINPKLSNDEGKAIEMHSLYLQNPATLDTSSQFFLRILDNLSKDNNIKTIVMSYDNYLKSKWIEQYNNCYFASGYLLEASIQEFCDQRYEKMYHILVNDVRAGHFSYRNHKILANLLLTYITSNIHFDLNKDLLKQFITDDNFNDRKFRQEEFMPEEFYKI